MTPIPADAEPQFERASSPTGATELAALTRRLSPFNPRGLYYTLARGFMHSVGRLSQGIRIGHRFGFDSGAMLDYVYADKAQGTTPLGRLIDRAYLDAPGWAGIRNRGVLLRATLARELAELAAANGRPPVLADLACGGGRYVLDGLADARDSGIAVDATLRDYRPENVEKASANAAQRGIAARIEQADAFDDTALAALARPDLVVVSGLHEIIPRDDIVVRHLHQIASLLPVGGRLVLTVQPEHPQLEFIARVLTSHTGEPWAMRLRPLALTRRWLEEAGFIAGRPVFEERGIFGVIVARRA